jgi:hypothetical protein
MRLSRSDANQQGRAALICKADAKRGLLLQAASDQYFIGRSENFRFRQASQEWDFPARFWDASHCDVDLINASIL